MGLREILRAAEKATFTEVYITIAGGRELTVENCTRVCECNEIMTRLKTRSGGVVIWGEELRTSSFREGVVKVSGKISSVEFEEGRAADD